MRKSLFIVIGLSIFGVLLGVFGSAGIGPQIDLPWIPDASQYEQYADSAVDGAMNTDIWNMANMVGTGIDTLVTTLTAVFFVAAILVACGVPVALAGAIQVIIWIMYLWDIVPFILNRVVR